MSWAGSPHFEPRLIFVQETKKMYDQNQTAGEIQNTQPQQGRPHSQ